MPLPPPTNNVSGDLLNIASTAAGKPLRGTAYEAMGDADLQTAASKYSMPKEDKAAFNRAVANRNANNTANYGQDTSDFFGGLLFGQKNRDGSPKPGYSGFVNEAVAATRAAIDINNQNPLERIPQVTANWKDVLRNPMGNLLNEMGKRSPVFAEALGDLSPAVRNDMVDAIMAGDLGAAGADAIVGAIGPYLERNALAYLGKLYGETWGPRPVHEFLREYDWPNENEAPQATRADKTKRGDNRINVGHKGHMEVKLGGLRFEVPPATNSILNIAGGTGQISPGAGAGIMFHHVQNIAALMIPGGAPEYQSLGIQGQMVEFVGCFLGFDYNRLLDADLHSEKDPNDPTTQKLVGVDYDDTLNADPLYVKNPSANVSGSRVDSTNYNALKFSKGDNGSWAVSKRFQANVQAGVPQDFEIDSGVIKIKYSLIVTSIRRAYQRDDRTYYEIKAFAVGGVEGGGTEPTIRKKPKEDARSRQRPAPRPLPGASRGGGLNKAPTLSTPSTTTPTTAAAEAAKAAVAAAKPATPPKRAPGVRVAAPNPNHERAMRISKSRAEAVFEAAVLAVSEARQAADQVIQSNPETARVANRAVADAKQKLARADKAVHQAEVDIGRGLNNIASGRAAGPKYDTPFSVDAFSNAEGDLSAAREAMRNLSSQIRQQRSYLDLAEAKVKGRTPVLNPIPWRGL